MDLAALYARHAQRFDRTRTRTLVELPYLEKATALAPPPGSVLDLECGSGEPLARYFVEKGYRVTGIDAVREMLEMCRARFPEMTWYQTDMRHLEIPEHFEIVIAWDSFFHLSPDDQREMFATFRKHTAPGGVLIFTSGMTEGEAIGGDLFGDTLYHASLDTQEYARLLERHGYSVVLHGVEDPECGGHTVWVAQQGSTEARRSPSPASRNPVRPTSLAPGNARLVIGFEHRAFGSKAGALHPLRFVHEVQLDRAAFDSIRPDLHGAV